MVLYGLHLSYRVMAGHVSSCTVLYGPIRSCMILWGPVCSWKVLFCSVWSCMVQCGNVFLYALVYQVWSFTFWCEEKKTPTTEKHQILSQWYISTTLGYPHQTKSELKTLSNNWLNCTKMKRRKKISVAISIVSASSTSVHSLVLWIKSVDKHFFSLFTELSIIVEKIFHNRNLHITNSVALLVKMGPGCFV